MNRRLLPKLGVAAGFLTVLLFGGAAAHAATTDVTPLGGHGCHFGVPCAPALVDAVVKTWVDADVDVKKVDVDVDVLDLDCRDRHHRC
jgi:hypothetical protein